MIHVDLPATMECIEKDCGARLSVKLALSMGGTLLPRLPNGHGWQITYSQNGAFVCRCPKHHSVIEQPADGGRISNADPVVRTLRHH